MVDYRDKQSFFEMIRNERLFRKEDLLLDSIEYTVSDTKELVYITNSKVACSSIRLSFVEEGIDIPDDYSIHSYMSKNGYSKRSLSEKEKEFFTFTFVRDPFVRLVSCYKSKYHIDKKIKPNSDFKNYLGGFFSVDKGFQHFLFRIMLVPPRLLDRHFNIQSFLVYRKDGTSRCNYVGHYENIAEEFKPIQERFHLRPLAHYNKSGTEDWMDYYTPFTAWLVYRKYHKDIVNFGYQNTYNRLKKHLWKKRFNL